MNVNFLPDNVCSEMNVDKNETNLICIDIDRECPDCNICQVKFYVLKYKTKIYLHSNIQ